MKYTKPEMTYRSFTAEKILTGSETGISAQNRAKAAMRKYVGSEGTISDYIIRDWD